MHKTKDELNEYFEKNKDWIFINEIYLLFSDERNKDTRESNAFSGKIKFFISFLFVFCIQALNLLFKVKISDSQPLAVARVEREKYKTKRVVSDVQFITDDVKHGDFTIYRCGRRIDRVKFLLCGYTKDSLYHYRKIMEFVKDENIGAYRSTLINWVLPRIAHSVIFRNNIILVFKEYTPKTVYTGMLIERFALCVEQASGSCGKFLVNIPHGSEPTMKYPHELVGDKFYCTSSEIPRILSDMYKSEKYIFDENIAKAMFSVKKPDNYEEKVVYFTTPGIYEKESMEFIMLLSQHLSALNKALYIKVHPYENIIQYKQALEGYNVSFVDDLSYSIYGNICISVISTVLTEALYNESVSICIFDMLENEYKPNLVKVEFSYCHKVLRPSTKEEFFKKLDELLKSKEVKNE